MRREEAEAWWRAPLSSVVLVVAGLVVIFIMVWQGKDASPLGYSAGLALIGLGITGRISSWARNGKDGGG